MRKFSRLIFVSVLFFIFCGHAFSENYIILDDENESSTKESILKIKTNVDQVTVYLNGIYQGETPLEIKGLVPGIYEIKLLKKGYDAFSERIRIDNSKEFTYYASLEKRRGFVSLENVRDDCIVKIDGKQVSGTQFLLDEGIHSIVVKKFGYEDFSREVHVKANSFITVNVVLNYTEFVIKRVDVSKKVINPNYKGNLGKVQINAFVTAPETGSFIIYNRDNQEIFRKELGTFSTWNQTMIWSGIDSDGNICPDGLYKIVLEAGNTEKAAEVIVDSSINYDLVSLSPRGAGIGENASAIILPQGTTVTSIGFQSKFNNNDVMFPFGASFSISALDILEISGNFGVLQKNSHSSIYGNGTLKTAFEYDFADFSFGFGAGLSYGGAQKNLYEYEGVSSFAGLSPFLALGLDFSTVYAGYSCEFNFGAETGWLGNDSNVWKNGLSLKYRIDYKSALDIFGSMHSRLNNETNMFNAFEAGLNYSRMFSAFPVFMSLGAYSEIFPDRDVLFAVKLSVNYLF